MKKSNGIWSIVFIILAIAIVFTFIALLMPIALVGGLIATWFFTKKEPDQKKRNISIAVTVVGLIGSIIITPMLFKKSENTDVQTPQTTTIASTNSETSETATTTATEETTTQGIKNNGPEYTEDSNAAFATALGDKINQALADTGIAITVTYYDKNLIYAYVPQDFKYEPNPSIQKLADSIYQLKEEFFSEWAIDNGYDLNYTNAPALYIKSEDNTILAEESGIFNKKMKLKVDNN